jgi:DNA ligase-1
MQEQITKPMLSGKFDNFDVESKDLNFPLLCTPKFDGIRCLVVNGKALTRAFKPIPNQYIRALLEDNVPNGVDGELMDVRGWEHTASSIMRFDGEPQFAYYVFDYVKEKLTKPYDERMEDLKKLPLPWFCKKVLPVTVKNIEELLLLEQKFVADGYEGLMLRNPQSPYKCGRGTLRAQDLLKIKRFSDAEAVIIGYVEQRENTNEKTKDNFGLTKRSSAKAGMVGKGTLGKWIVKAINGQFKGVEFGLGTAKGVTQEMRQEWWNNRKQYIGRIVTFKYQPIGSVDAPRLPVFKGFRDTRDM